jgi:hypothetical protein
MSAVCTISFQAWIPVCLCRVGAGIVLGPLLSRNFGRLVRSLSTWKSVRPTDRWPLEPTALLLLSEVRGRDVVVLAAA